MKAAIFVREVNDQWFERISFILRSLSGRGVKLFYYKSFCQHETNSGSCSVPEGGYFSDWSDLPADTDFLLCFGGDGTLLESISVMGERRIPVAGINFGRLGFLTSVDSQSGTEWIDKLLSGNYTVEERSMLEVSYSGFPAGFCRYALNEVSLQRNDSSLLSVQVTLNSVKLPVYWSNGLLLSTPTGSTAYSLSVGGPIVLPVVEAFLLVPIAPHNLNVRPLIVPEDSVITMFVEARNGKAMLNLDNRTVTIAEKEIITVSKAKCGLKYISFNPTNFINALEEKLLWGRDWRNNG